MFFVSTVLCIIIVLSGVTFWTNYQAYGTYMPYWWWVIQISCIAILLRDVIRRIEENRHKYQLMYLSIDRKDLDEAEEIWLIKKIKEFAESHRCKILGLPTVDSNITLIRLNVPTKYVGRIKEDFEKFYEEERKKVDF